MVLLLLRHGHITCKGLVLNPKPVYIIICLGLQQLPARHGEKLHSYAVWSVTG